MPRSTVFIVGAGGMVGAAAAQTLAVKEIVQDIALIDVAQELVLGQATDINHAAAYTNGVRVRVGDYSEIREDDIVVIACGLALARAPGKSRLELLDMNVEIIRDVVRKIMAQGKPVFILMVTNPVDVLTHIALEASGLPKERVFGTGTTIDTARLRVTLGNALHVDQQSIDAYVLGEHGDSSFPALSSATISGIPLAQFPGFRPEIIATIEQDIRESAYKIIAAKRSTCYGIGHAIAKLVEAMQHDTGNIYPTCSLTTGEYGLENVVMGLPSIVSSRGVSIVDSYPLSQSERLRLENSASIIRAAYRSILQRDYALD